MIARWCSGLTAACVLSAAFLAGCSSSTTTGNGVSSMSAASKSAVCTSADDLKASITALKDVNIRANGASAVSAQFTKIKQDFATLKADIQGQYTPQVNALSSALDKLGASLDAAKASLNAGTLSALASAAGSVVTAGTNLVTAVSSTC
jgi:predicted component of type VI protein secretion system